MNENETKWGVTHCPWCELPYAQEVEYDEWDRLYEVAKHNEKDAQLVAFGDKYCWMSGGDPCLNYNKASWDGDQLERLIAVLRERDEAHARVAELEAKQQLIPVTGSDEWHYCPTCGWLFHRK